MDRRQFFKIFGTTSIGIAGFGCRSRYEEFFDLQEDRRSDINVTHDYVNAICGLCGAGCGIQARVVNGNIISVRGNPLSPLNRGNICIRGAAATQHLYNSNRIKSPMILSGKKGSGEFQEISWDEAISIVAGRLGKLRQTGEPHKAAMISGYQRGLTDRLFQNFFSFYGSPNYMKIVPDAGVQSVLKLMHGESGNIGFDMEKSNYILNFGVNLFESSSSPVWHNRLYGFLNREREGRRAKLVHIDSIANITAYKSDEWIKVNPGTAGALALGIANVLVRRGLYDSGFVKSHTFGFEDWTDSKRISHKGFKNILLDEYDPQKISKITKVPIRDIERIAHEFARNSPGIAIFDDNLANMPGGTYSQMAVHSLNALVGNINSAGGVFTQQEIPFSEMPSMKKDPAAVKGLSRQKVDLAQTSQFPLAESVVPNILQDHAKGQIDTLFIHNCNPLYTLHECDKYKELFQNIPFVVNFSSFYDETTQYCDLLLPEPTFLEKWQDVPAGSQTGINQILGISKPVISPLYNTRHAGDVFLNLASAIGAPLSGALPWETFENYLKESLKGVFESKSGMIFSGVYDESFLENLERSGWQYSTYATFDEFLEQIVESGGWWNPVLSQMKSKTSFKTPSGKFEFFSRTLLNRMIETGSGRSDYNSLNDELFMPHFETPQYLGNPSEDHLILIPFETGALRDGAVDSQPSLMGVLNPIDNEKWDSWIEMNQRTALKFNLRHNDNVRVESPYGSFITKLKISNRVVPGAVGIPEGLGHVNPNNPNESVGVNPNSILGSNIDRISGKDAKRGTRVNVYKI